MSEDQASAADDAADAMSAQLAAQLPVDAAPAAAPTPAPRRHPLADVAAAPHRWDFYRVMRLVDARHADKPKLGTARRPVDEPVRLGQAVELAFAHLLTCSCGCSMRRPS